MHSKHILALALPALTVAGCKAPDGTYCVFDFYGECEDAHDGGVPEPMDEEPTDGEQTEPDPCVEWGMVGLTPKDVLHDTGSELYWLALDQGGGIGVEWAWSATPGPGFAPAQLDAGGTIVLATNLSSTLDGGPGMIWLQADPGLAVTLSSAMGSLPVQELVVDGETVYRASYTNADAALGSGQWYWVLEGTGVVRGQSHQTLALAGVAGPDYGLLTSTQADMRAWMPQQNWCHEPAEPPGSDGGSSTGGPPEPEPEPEPQPEPQPEDPPGTFDPCVELGYGPTTVRPAGYSPTWVGESETWMVTLWISPIQAWHWGPHELVEGLRSNLGSWGTVLVDEAPAGAVAAYVLVEDIVDPFTMPAMTRSTSTSVQDADAVQLADNSWLVWVDEPGAGAATWYSGDTLPQLRGWARDGLAGVPATGGNPGVANTVGGNGWAFMPAIGYCLADATPEPPAADESGG